MPFSFNRFIRLGGLSLICLVSAGLMGYAWWLFQIERGDRALRRGDYGTATEIYETAQAPFLRLPLLASVVKEDYRRLVFTQAAALYKEGRYQEILATIEERAGRFPFLTESGAYSFWVGNALLRSAIQSPDSEDAVNGLKAALAEYQKGLAAQPEDWDLKYNYELVKNILSQRDRDKKKEDERVKSILEKMRLPLEPTKGGLAPERKG